MYVKLSAASLCQYVLFRGLTHVNHVQAFLLSESVKAALNESRSALAALSVLKKICDHPALLSERAAQLVASGGKAFSCKCTDLAPRMVRLERAQHALSQRASSAGH